VARSDSDSDRLSLDRHLRLQHLEPEGLVRGEEECRILQVPAACRRGLHGADRDSSSLEVDDSHLLGGRPRRWPWSGRPCGLRYRRSATGRPGRGQPCGGPQTALVMQGQGHESQTVTG
jgi:hypothetical protein